MTSMCTGSKEMRRKYVEEMILPQNLKSLILDQYGNYVLQNALQHLPPDLHLLLTRKMSEEDVYDTVLSTLYGVQIIAGMYKEPSHSDP